MLRGRRRQSSGVPCIVLVTLFFWLLALHGVERAEGSPQLDEPDGYSGVKEATAAEAEAEAKQLHELDAASSHEEGAFMKEELEEQSYSLQQEQKNASAGRTVAPPHRSSLAFTILTRSLTIAMVIIAGLIAWDIMNFVGDVPDPFGDVESPEGIPGAIEHLLDQGKPIAFVVR